MKIISYKPILVIALVSGLLFSSCRKDKWPCINGRGPSITQTRSIEGVTEISIGSEATVYITQASTYSCTINAQQNIADNLEFRQSGGRLSIYDDHCIRSYSPISIYITVPELNSISLSGSCTVVTSGIFSVSWFEANISGSGTISINDSIIAGSASAKISGSGDLRLIGRFTGTDTRISGSGSITLGGSSNTHSISISGSGKVHSFNFLTSSATVKTSGSGDSEVWVTNSLDVNISGSGNVWYRGYPAITTHISGSGDVRSAN